MGCSFDELVSYLPSNKFKILHNCFSNHTEAHKKLHQKGHDPYTYFDDFDKFEKKSYYQEIKTEIAFAMGIVQSENLDGNTSEKVSEVPMIQLRRQPRLSYL